MNWPLIIGIAIGVVWFLAWLWDASQGIDHEQFYVRVWGFWRRW